MYGWVCVFKVSTHFLKTTVEHILILTCPVELFKHVVHLFFGFCALLTKLVAPRHTPQDIMLEMTPKYSIKFLIIHKLLGLTPGYGNHAQGLQFNIQTM